LLDKKKFQKAFIEPAGGIAWDNGYDFCPNYLKELSAEKNRDVKIVMVMDTKSWKEIKDAVYGKKGTHAGMLWTGILKASKSVCY